MQTKGDPGKSVIKILLKYQGIQTGTGPDPLFCERVKIHGKEDFFMAYVSEDYIKAYKAGKWFLKVTNQTEKLEEMQKNAGSEDYRNAKGIMKPTFVKVVNDDVSDILKDVKCSTLLVWGEFDTAAPLWMGKQMEKEMPDAGLAIFENDDHWAYWHQPDRFNAVLDIFFKGDEA